MRFNGERSSGAVMAVLAVWCSGCFDLNAGHYAFGDAGVDAGSEQAGDCARACDTPPAAHCVGPKTLEAFPSHGRCSANGGCGYNPVTIRCASACENDHCVDEPCAGVFCETPPPPQCRDDATVASYSGPGTCNAGQCTYPSTVQQCPGGCANNFCAGNACAGKQCLTPPEPKCLDQHTLRQFVSPGSCSGTATAACVYDSADVACANGCSAGACLADPCAGQVCQQPPAKTCVNSTTKRSFAAVGTCNQGTCEYTSTEVVCLAGQQCVGGECEAVAVDGGSAGDGGVGSKARIEVAAALPFGTVPWVSGTQASRRLTVKNVGEGPLFFEQGAPFKLSGPQAAEFSAVLSNAYDPVGGLAPGDVVTVQLTLSPTAVGSKLAVLTLSTNDPQLPKAPVTLSANVSVVDPCSWSVTPSSLDFGNMPRGLTKTLPVTVTNTGAAPCYLSNVDLKAGTHPGFTLAGGPVDSKVIAAGEAWVLSVRVAPVNDDSPISGELVFSISSPPSPTGTVSLRATTLPPCVVVTPDPTDFGTARVGCTSPAHTFTVFNACPQPIQISSVTMQDGAGEPEGGADCPTQAACPEFVLTTLPPAAVGVGATATFQATYSPVNSGDDLGAIAVTYAQVDGGVVMTTVVGLLGQGNTTGQRTDTFVQPASPLADVLFVVDDSGSMQDKQANLAANFTSFIQYATAANVDYHLGVTSTTVTNDQVCWPFGCTADKSNAPGGLLYRKPPDVGPVLTRQTPAIADKFTQLVSLGTEGSGAEQGLETAVLALTPPRIGKDNLGFLRDDANLVVIIVSDASDQSPQPVSTYLERLLNVKGLNRRSMFTFSDIGPLAASAPSPCTYDDSHDPSRYAALVASTGGVSDEICTTNWSATLTHLGDIVFAPRTQFFLANTPDRTAGKVLEVKIDNVVQAQGWVYDQVSNSVQFTGASAPKAGQTLTVRYDIACL